MIEFQLGSKSSLKRKKRGSERKLLLDHRLRCRKICLLRDLECRLLRDVAFEGVVLIHGRPVVKRD